MVSRHRTGYSKQKIRAAFVIWPIHSVREIKERQRSSARPRIRLSIKGGTCRELIKKLNNKVTDL